MKKLLSGLLAVCLLLGVAGCGKEAESETVPTSRQSPLATEASNSTTSTPEEAPASDSMTALVMPTVHEESFSDDGTPLFTLSFPRFQLLLGNAELEETITGALHERMRGILSDAEEIGSAAQEDFLYADPAYWSPYSCSVAYTPTRLDNSILSLFGNRSRYSGGAHPSHVTDSVTFDLHTGKALELTDILRTSEDIQTLCTLVLASLAEKADTLSYGYEETVTEAFGGDLSNVPQWYFSRTGLCFHFPPYAIAPYSSGTIIAEIPYEDLQTVLQETYFPITSADATGSIYVQSGEEDKLFDFTADVVLAENADPIFLYSDAKVADVRIETGTPLSDGTGFISTGVIFMADTLNLGEGIRLYADLFQPDLLLRLVYRSGEHEVSSLITMDAAGNAVLAGS